MKKNCKLKRIKFFDIASYIISILLFLIILMLVLNPTRYMNSVLAGVNLFFYSIFPSLFPFFFISNLLTEFGMVQKISNLFKGFTQKVFRVPAISSYVFLMSILCGYPVGAKLIADLYEKGSIDENQAKKILPLASSSGPIFVIGAVGAGILGDARLGALIYISHILSCIITALILRGKNIKSTAKVHEYQSLPIDNFLNKSINSSITSILAVGAYVCIFYMFIDFAYDLHILKFGQDLIAKLLSFLKIDSGFSQGLASGLIEMTRGCKEIGFIGDKFFQLIFCTFLITFSGFSIIVQSLSFLANTKIKTHTLLFVKCVQSIVSIGVSIVFGLIFL